MRIKTIVMILIWIGIGAFTMVSSFTNGLLFGILSLLMFIYFD